MKILLISTQVFPVQCTPSTAYGGLEMVVYDLAEELGRLEGQQVYVLGPEGTKGEHFEAITPCKPSFGNPEQVAYEAIGPSLSSFDVIHDHSWGGHVYLSKQQRPRLPVLHTLHAQMTYQTLPLERPCWVAASQFHAGFIAGHLSTNPRVVYHGIDLERHSYRPAIEKEDYLLYLARVQHIKGAMEFIALCQATGMKGKLAGEDCFIPAQEQPYVRQVMQACQNTRGQVEYLGRVGQEWKVELLRKARCLVCPLNPPYYEIFGLTTIEAAACGTPVLSTDRGAASELIDHGATGAVAHDVDCLETNLEIALRCQPEDCVRWAQGFSRSEMAQCYLKLYQEVQEGVAW